MNEKVSGETNVRRSVLAPALTGTKGQDSTAAVFLLRLKGGQRGRPVDIDFINVFGQRQVDVVTAAAAVTGF